MLSKKERMQEKAARDNQALAKIQAKILANQQKMEALSDEEDEGLQQKVVISKARYQQFLQYLQQ